jgi:hypothetical protein
VRSVVELQAALQESRPLRTESSEDRVVLAPLILPDRILFFLKAIYFFYFYFFWFFETGFPPASASRVLGLKACATTPGSLDRILIYSFGVGTDNRYFSLVRSESFGKTFYSSVIVGHLPRCGGPWEAVAT